jgi:hypothetical protein
MGGTHNMREEDKKSRNILVGKRQEKLLFWDFGVDRAVLWPVLIIHT